MTNPLVVRAVEPILRELDPAEEEAARTLGASPFRTVCEVMLPPVMPAIFAGTLQSFARAVAEFGSLVVVSGNIPFRTLTAPVFIFGEVEARRQEAAAAVSVVLLGLAVALQNGARWLGQGREARRDT